MSYILWVEAAVLAVVFYFQWRQFSENQQNIKELDGIFPKQGIMRVVRAYFLPEQASKLPAEFVQHEVMTTDKETVDFSPEEEDDSVFRSYAQANLIGGYYSSPIYRDLCQDINISLLRSKNYVADFKLMQETVERHCGTQTSLVENALNVPLYYGLLGSMIGVVIGCFKLGFLSELDDPQSVNQLLTIIGAAMIVSAIGLVFTVFSLSKYRLAFAGMERGKNRFLSFIQSELIPVLQTDMDKSILTLQGNLQRFNDDFSVNLKKFNYSIEQVSGNMAMQSDFLQKLDDINIKQTTRGMSQLMDSLDNGAAAFRQFENYQESLAGTIIAMDKTFKKLAKMMERTENFEENMNGVLRQFRDQDQTHRQLLEALKGFEHEIEERKKMTSRMVDEVDRLFNEQFQVLAKNTQNHSTNYENIRDEHIQTVRDSFGHFQRLVQGEMNKLQELAQKEMQVFQETFQDKRSGLAHLNELPEIKSALKEMTDAIVRSNKDQKMALGTLQATMQQIVSRPQVASRQHSTENGSPRAKKQGSSKKVGHPYSKIWQLFVKEEPNNETED